MSAALFAMVACSAPQNNNTAANAGQQTATDWKAVEQALGKSGAMQPGDVYKVSLPRSDLEVTVVGVGLKPALALGSWVAFKKAGDMMMVMGDLVLTEDEVTPVLSKLQEGGVEVTALHNHVLHESPRVMYMHIHAMGDGQKIAKAIHDALALSKTPFTAPAPSASPNPDIGIDTKQIDQIMGQTGKINGVVFQYSIARADDITDAAMTSGSFVIPPAMGVAQAINFQPTGGGKAAITGDFVLLAGEVNPVIKALRDNGIEVTALHSHMLTDSPHLFFMHFWANDDVLKLARGLRAALDRVNVKKS
jgi:biotin operon repressor